MVLSCKEKWQSISLVSAVLFIISQIRGCRAGAVMSFSNMQDTIGIACEALKALIAKDKNA